MSRGFSGYMAARIGVRNLASQAANEIAEENAGDDTNDPVKAAEELQKAQAKEYSGIVGKIRYEVRDHPNLFPLAALQQQEYTAIGAGYDAFESGKGIGGIISAAASAHQESPDQQAKELSDAVDQAKRQAAQEKTAKLGMKFQDKFRAREQKEADESAIAGTEGYTDRAALKSRYELRDANADADTLSQMNFQKAGFHSEKDLQAAVAQERAQAAQRYDEQQLTRDKDAAQKSQAMVAETDEAKKMEAGDSAGAKREKFMQGLDEKSRSAHKESAALGDQFDQQVKPELIKQYDQEIAAQRAEDEQHAQDVVTKIQEEATAARLKAQGDSYQAERAAKFASLDEQVAKAQEAANKEKDAFQKANLQKVADATRDAAASEGQSFDANHDREDEQRAKEMAMRFSGNGEQAEEYEAGIQLQKDGDKAVYDEKIKEAKYREEQQQRQRDVREDESAARAGGKGELASYEGLRDKEQEDIRKAELTGNPDRIAQARRTAANDITAYQKEHQDKAQTFGSTEDFANHLMMAGGGNGIGDAIKMAKRDANDLKNGKDLGDKSHAAAEKTANAADAMKNFGDKLAHKLDNPIKFVIADVV